MMFPSALTAGSVVRANLIHMSVRAAPEVASPAIAIAGDTARSLARRGTARLVQDAALCRIERLIVETLAEFERAPIDLSLVGRSKNTAGFFGWGYLHAAHFPPPEICCANFDLPTRGRLKSGL